MERQIVFTETQVDRNGVFDIDREGIATTRDLDVLWPNLNAVFFRDTKNLREDGVWALMLSRGVFHRLAHIVSKLKTSETWRYILTRQKNHSGNKSDKNQTTWSQPKHAGAL